MYKLAIRFLTILYFIIFASPSYAEIRDDILEQNRVMFDRVFVPIFMKKGNEDCRTDGHPSLENFLINNFTLSTNMSYVFARRSEMTRSTKKYLLYVMNVNIAETDEEIVLNLFPRCSFYTILKRFINGEKVKVLQNDPKPAMQYAEVYNENIAERIEEKVYSVEDMYVHYYEINGKREKYRTSRGQTVYPYYVTFTIPPQILAARDSGYKALAKKITLRKFFGELAQNNDKKAVQIWCGYYSPIENISMSIKNPRSYVMFKYRRPDILDNLLRGR